MSDFIMGFVLGIIVMLIGVDRVIDYTEKGIVFVKQQLHSDGNANKEATQSSPPK